MRGYDQCTEKFSELTSAIREKERIGDAALASRVHELFPHLVAETSQNVSDAPAADTRAVLHALLLEAHHERRVLYAFRRYCHTHNGTSATAGIANSSAGTTTARAVPVTEGTGVPLNIKAALRNEAAQGAVPTSRSPRAAAPIHAADDGAAAGAAGRRARQPRKPRVEESEAQDDDADDDPPPPPPRRARRPAPRADPPAAQIDDPAHQDVQASAVRAPVARRAAKPPRLAPRAKTATGDEAHADDTSAAPVSVPRSARGRKQADPHADDTHATGAAVPAPRSARVRRQVDVHADDATDDVPTAGTTGGQGAAAAGPRRAPLSLGNTGSARGQSSTAARAAPRAIPRMATKPDVAASAEGAEDGHDGVGGATVPTRKPAARRVSGSSGVNATRPTNGP